MSRRVFPIRFTLPFLIAPTASGQLNLLSVSLLCFSAIVNLIQNPKVLVRGGLLGSKFQKPRATQLRYH